jgi:hypothetical protein
LGISETKNYPKKISLKYLKSRKSKFQVPLLNGTFLETTKILNPGDTLQAGFVLHRNISALSLRVVNLHHLGRIYSLGEFRNVPENKV